MGDRDEPDDPRAILRPLRRVRQVREFTAEPPSDAALDAMADVGRWSGSSRNEQPWRFLILRDEAVLRRIWEIGVPQTRALATATAGIAIVLPERGHELADAYDDGRAAERLLDRRVVPRPGRRDPVGAERRAGGRQRGARPAARPLRPDDRRTRPCDRRRRSAEGGPGRGAPAP